MGGGFQMGDKTDDVETIQERFWVGGMSEVMGEQVTHTHANTHTHTHTHTHARLSSACPVPVPSMPQVKSGIFAFLDPRHTPQFTSFLFLFQVLPLLSQSFENIQNLIQKSSSNQSSASASRDAAAAQQPITAAELLSAGGGEPAGGAAGNKKKKVRKT